MKEYMSPDGARIIGTSETILGTAMIMGIDDDGSPKYIGSTDIDWESQTTKTRDGKILYADDDGFEWTFDQLLPVPDEE